MTRLLTAAVLIPVVLYAVFGGLPWLLLAVIELFAVLAWMEYASVVGLEPVARGLGLIVGIGLIAAPLEKLAPWLFVLAAIALVIGLFPVDLATGFRNAAAVLLGIFYVFGAMKTGYMLGQRNPWLLFFALALNWIGDSGAYYVGRAFGRNKLAPLISPGKTWEGAIASLFLATVVTAFVMPRFLSITIPFAALFGFLGNAAGQAGDLAESALKRSAGVKDSGTLLPGHGGVLDRIDSTLFTFPVAYLYTTWLAF